MIKILLNSIQFSVKVILWGVICFTFLFSQNKSAAKIIYGNIIDEKTGQPIENCIILIHNLDLKKSTVVLSNSEGYFSHRVRPKSFLNLSISRIGYIGLSSGPYFLHYNDSLNINFTLSPDPHVLKEVVIKEKHEIRRLSDYGFYERFKAGNGKYITPEEIENIYSTEITSIFYRLAGISVVQGKLYSARGGTLDSRSEIAVFLDGTKIAFYDDIRNIISKQDLLAVEFYRTSEVPSKFAGYNTANGILLLWTK